MRLKYLTHDQIRALHREHMERDFPPDELKGADRILEHLADGCYAVYGAFEGDVLMGYAMLGFDAGHQDALLDYLAILPPYRGMGLGTQLMDLICAAIPQCGGLFVESECADVSPEAARRLDFYARAHCPTCGLQADVYFVPYEICYRAIGRGAEDLRARLDAVYEGMYPPAFRQNFIRWH